MDLGPFWEENMDLLKKIVSVKVPPKSRFHFYYSEPYDVYLEDVKKRYVGVTTINISKERKYYLVIEAEFKNSDILREEIRVGSGENVERCDVTILKGREISERHKSWLRTLFSEHELSEK